MTQKNILILKSKTQFVPSAIKLVAGNGQDSLSASRAAQEGVDIAVAIVVADIGIQQFTAFQGTYDCGTSSTVTN